jgi:hypothetical protein
VLSLVSGEAGGALVGTASADGEQTRGETTMDAAEFAAWTQRILTAPNRAALDGLATALRYAQADADQAQLLRLVEVRRASISPPGGYHDANGS